MVETELLAAVTAQLARRLAELADEGAGDWGTLVDPLEPGAQPRLDAVVAGLGTSTSGAGATVGVLLAANGLSA